MRKFPDFKYENELWKKDYYIIGVDEVGRGALAGPVYAGAVCFNNDLKSRLIYFEKLGIDDSKRLSPAKRKKLAGIIKQTAFAYSTAGVSNKVINRIGIVKATQMAMRRAIKALYVKCYELGRKKIYILVDGFNIKYLKGIGLKNQKAIIKGDQKSISIAAASIVAKVERDQNMIKLHQQYPIYLWKKNKGYGTKKHREAIKKFGKLAFHRDLFIRKIR